MIDSARSDDREEGFEELYPLTKPWGRQARSIVAIIWPAFLSAAFATMLFFAFVDPGLVGDAMTPTQEFSRMTGYALGFFFFWLITMVSSSISILLIRSYNRKRKDKQGSTKSDE